MICHIHVIGVTNMCDHEEAWEYKNKKQGCFLKYFSSSFLVGKRWVVHNILKQKLYCLQNHKSYSESKLHILVCNQWPYSDPELKKNWTIKQKCFVFILLCCHRSFDPHCFSMTATAKVITGRWWDFLLQWNPSSFSSFNFFVSWNDKIPHQI